VPETRDPGQEQRRAASSPMHERYTADWLLRRHDFTIDILGGAPSLLYATGYRDVGGIIIPGGRCGPAANTVGS